MKKKYKYIMSSSWCENINFEEFDTYKDAIDILYQEVGFYVFDIINEQEKNPTYDNSFEMKVIRYDCILFTWGDKNEYMKFEVVESGKK